jgi:hypothetical protein
MLFEFGEPVLSSDDSIKIKFAVSTVLGWFVVFNATFNNISVISWRSVLLMEETRGPGEKH